MKKYFLYILMLLIEANLYGELVDKVEVQSSNLSKEEKSGFLSYLERFLGKEGTLENLKYAENFFLSSYIVAKASCQYSSGEKNLLLSCDITPKRKIGKIEFSYLPAPLLEEEIVKKIPVRVGQDISEEELSKTSKDRLKAAVKNFLEREGFCGFDLDIVYYNQENSRLTFVVIEINNGFFAQVNKIHVQGEETGDFLEKIKLDYGRMCLIPSKLIESILVGQVNCFSPDIEKETTKMVLDGLIKKGYIQADIRVIHKFINVNDPQTPRKCIKNINGKMISTCVDLDIVVNRGPLVRWDIKIQDNENTETNAFLRLMGTIFGKNILSRMTLNNDDHAIAKDRRVTKTELEEEVTFSQSRTVDDYEINLSSEKIKSFLTTKGYPNAAVSVQLYRKEPSLVKIKFLVRLNEPEYISKVHIMPKFYSEFLNKDQLDELVGKRSFLNPGNVIGENIEKAKMLLKDSLEKKGFVDVEVNSSRVVDDFQGTNIYFYISSKERKITKKVVIKNGQEAVNNELFPVLACCDKYDPKKHSCEGSSLSEMFLQRDKDLILDTYRLEGYLYVDVEAKVEKFGEDNHVVFKLVDTRIGKENETPSPQEIKNFLILGNNNSTNEKAIKRLFHNWSDPKIFSPLDIKRGVGSLRSSSLFGMEHKLLSGAKDSEDIYFLLNLSKRPTLKGDLAVSFSTDNRLMLETSIRDKNLFGTMTRLNSSAGWGFFWGKKSYIENRFNWPKMFGQEIFLTLDFPTFIYNDFSHREEPTTRLKTKGSLNVDYRLNADVNIFTRYTLYHIQERKIKDTVNAKTNSFKNLDGLIPTIKTPGKIRGVLSSGINWVKVDDVFMPKKGIIVNNWVDLSGKTLFGNPPFLSLSTEESFYYTLFPFTFAFHASLMRSFIQPTKENFDDMKNSIAFDLLGGDNSVRGYKDGGIGLKTPSFKSGTLSGYVSQNCNVEIRFPLSFSSSAHNLQGAFFFDEGSVFPVKSLFSFDKHQSMSRLVREKALGFSFGPSLRYILPIGPLSLDYAYAPLIKDYRIHVIFGYAF